MPAKTVTVLIQRKGHTLPVVQGQLPYHQIGFEIDQHVKCGNHTYSTASLMYRFLNRQLKGIAPARPVPRVCIVRDDNHGLVLRRVPVSGSDSLTVPSTTVLAGPPPVATALAIITQKATYIRNVISA